jgi:hypothetical protein
MPPNAQVQARGRGCGLRTASDGPDGRAASSAAAGPGAAGVRCRARPRDEQPGPERRRPLAGAGAGPDPCHPDDAQEREPRGVLQPDGQAREPPRRAAVGEPARPALERSMGRPVTPARPSTSAPRGAGTDERNSAKLVTSPPTPATRSRGPRRGPPGTGARGPGRRGSARPKQSPSPHRPPALVACRATRPPHGRTWCATASSYCGPGRRRGERAPRGGLPARREGRGARARRGRKRDVAEAHRSVGCSVDAERHSSVAQPAAPAPNRRGARAGCVNCNVTLGGGAIGPRGRLGFGALTPAAADRCGERRPWWCPLAIALGVELQQGERVRRTNSRLATSPFSVFRTSKVSPRRFQRATGYISPGATATCRDSSNANRFASLLPMSPEQGPS